MESFKKLEMYFEDLRARKEKLQVARVQLMAEKKELEKQFETAFLNDDGHDEIQAKMERVDSDIANIDRKISILDKAGDGSETLVEIARGVNAEGQALAVQLRAKGDEQAQKCIRLRDEYLKELAALGQLHREGSTISYRCSLASDYIPGTKVHVGIPDRWQEVKPDVALCERVYQQKQH